MRVTDPPCQTPSVMPPPARTLSGRGVLDRAGRKLPRQSRPRTGPWCGEGSGKGLAIRHSGDVLLGGASGASGLLLNTKASQEAACSRAPAAIVPGRVPELRDAGVSRFGENGSHLTATDAGESHAGQVKLLIHSVPRCYPPPLLCRPRLLSASMAQKVNPPISARRRSWCPLSR